MPAHRDPPLTVDEIVDTALTLTAEHGLGALTMRAVAGAVGVTQMSLYHHLADKGALIDLVADAVVAGVPMPAEDLAWDRWLIEYHDALWKRLHGYPGLARHLLEHPSTPAGAAIRHRDRRTARRPRLHRTRRAARHIDVPYSSARTPRCRGLTRSNER